jgi:hypothetical protein
MIAKNPAHARRRRLEERVMVWIMRLMIGGAAAILLVILGVIVYRGAGALS